MLKIMFLTILTILTGCSSRQINGKNQTFVEYVILNKNSDWKGTTFSEVEAECFPLIRLEKWNKAKKEKE